MRVLVIGGTQFIGPQVVAALHRQGHEITLYHRGHHEPEAMPAVRHVHRPQAGMPVLEFPAELSDSRPEVVLHMVPVGEEDARAAALRFAGVARRIVGLSSGDVYRAYGRLLGTESGPLEPMPLGEQAPLRQVLYPYRHTAVGPADWTYHYEKILAERAIMSGPSLVGTVLRLPAVYGPGDPYHRLRPFIKRMEDRRPAILLESAQATWRWTHGYVENIAQAIALAVVDDRTAGKIYNLGEADTPTVADRVRQIREVAGWTGSVVALPRSRLPTHLRAPYEPQQDIVIDSTRFRQELEFDDPVSVGEGLRRTVEWERVNPPAGGDPSAAEYAEEDEALYRT